MVTLKYAGEAGDRYSDKDDGCDTGDYLYLFITPLSQTPSSGNFCRQCGRQTSAFGPNWQGLSIDRGYKPNWSLSPQEKRCGRRARLQTTVCNHCPPTVTCLREVDIFSGMEWNIQNGTWLVDKRTRLHSWSIKIVTDCNPEIIWKTYSTERLKHCIPQITQMQWLRLRWFVNKDRQLTAHWWNVLSTVMVRVQVRLGSSQC